MMVLRKTAMIALGLGLAACGDPAGGRDSGNSGGIPLPTSGSDGGTGETEQESADGDKLDLGSISDLPGGNDECAAVSEGAELVPLPADIIFVVDNSGSMDFEAQQIQQELNGFSAQIIASGIDVRVILVSSYPNDGNGICIEPPLGGGGCPNADDNPPTFTHVDERVGSHDAWEVLLATHGEWGPMLRQESSKHIVVTTDDTSNMDLTEFNAQFLALDPSYAEYIHHSVVCHSNCADAAGIGTNYIELSNMTGGIASDLCDQDFQTVFDVLSTEVIGGTELACEFEIPPPPDGMEFNPNQVNLEFDDGMGGLVEFGRVDSPAGCGAVADGWYYDNPAAPTMIVMCPQTCDMMQESENGAINIKFGCATVPAG